MPAARAGSAAASQSRTTSGEEPVAGGVVLGHGLVAAVAVDADRRTRTPAPRAGASSAARASLTSRVPCTRLSQDAPLLVLGPAAGDRLAGEMDDRVDARRARRGRSSPAAGSQRNSPGRRAPLRVRRTTSWPCSREGAAQRRPDQSARPRDQHSSRLDSHRILLRVRSRASWRSPGPTGRTRRSAGDLTAALAYVTPAGGAVVTAVAPVGLRDRDAGTVSFTTSLGLRQEARADRAQPARRARLPRPRARLRRRARLRARAGRRGPVDRASPRIPRETLRPPATRFMGPPKEGKLFWDRWLREYYQDRVPVAVEVERVSVWDDLRLRRPPRRARGAARPASRRAQAEPKQRHRPARRRGAGRPAPARPRPRAARLRRRRRLPRGRARSRSATAGPTGIRLSSRAPAAAGRPAGRASSATPTGAKLIGLAARQHTGWLTVDEHGAVYAPHTESGFRAPPNKTLLLLLQRPAGEAGPAARPQAARQLRRARCAHAPDSPRRPRKPRTEPGPAEYGALTPSTRSRSPGLIVATRGRDEDARSLLGHRAGPADRRDASRSRR